MVFDIGFYDFVISDFQEIDFSSHTHKIKIKQKLLKSNGFCKDAPVVLTFVDQDNNLVNQRVTTSGEESEILLNLAFQPKAVFLNYPMALNLAQFSSSKMSKDRECYLYIFQPEHKRGRSQGFNLCLLRKPLYST